MKVRKCHHNATEEVGDFKSKKGHFVSTGDALVLPDQTVVACVERDEQPFVDNHLFKTILGRCCAQAQGIGRVKQN